MELINRRDAIILPRGTDVNNLNPGNTEFPEYHRVFIQLLAVRLGIPQPLLTQSGLTTNKATLQEMKKDLYDDIQADELIVKQAIEDQIFKPACELQFGEDFDEIPSFYFNEVQEDIDLKVERQLKESQTTLNQVTAL